MFPIQVMRLRLASAANQVNIFNQTLLNALTAPATSTVFYQLAASGVGSATRQADWTWLLIGLNSDYQVRVTLISGTSPSGNAVGSWFSLGTTRSWNLSRSTVGNTVGQILVEIRRVVDSTVIDSATIDMTAEVDL